MMELMISTINAVGFALAIGIGLLFVYGALCIMLGLPDFIGIGLMILMGIPAVKQLLRG